jgi:P27 family predicted phage terminase small subunit
MNAPKWLDKTGRSYWKILTPQLERDGILTDATFDLVAIACQAYSTYRKAHETLEEEGRVITSHTGARKTNPMLAVEKQAFEQLCRVFKELGIAKKPELDGGIDVEEFA